MSLPADEVERITRELAASRGFQPVSVADNVPYEQYAAITVRLPDLPGVAASRGFTRFYPGGSTVGQLVGYVGAASAAEYEKENKNPLLLIPGVKIGKEGLEQTLEPTLRGEPGGQRVEVTARGKLVKELEPKPDRSGGTVQLTIDSDLHQYAARRIGDQSGSVVVHRRHQRRHPRDAVDAVVRPQQFLGRDQPERVEDAVGRRSSAARRQGTGEPLPVRLDDQAVDGDGAAQCRHRPHAEGQLHRRLFARQSHLPLRQASRPGRYGRGRRPELRRLFLRDVPPGRRREARRRWSGRWASARSSTCRSTTSATAPSPIPTG